MLVCALSAAVALSACVLIDLKVTTTYVRAGSGMRLAKSGSGN